MVQKNIEEVRSLTQGRNLIDNALGYYACNLELDKALEYLLQRLEQANKLDNTVIVLAGDHYPYYLDSDSKEYDINELSINNANFNIDNAYGTNEFIHVDKAGNEIQDGYYRMEGNNQICSCYL